MIVLIPCWISLVILKEGRNLATYDKYFSIEENTQVKSTLTVINSGLEEPFLAIKIAELLSDEHLLSNVLSDKDKINTGNFLYNYHRVCWNLFTDAEDMARLERGLKYAKRELYKVDAPMGERFATTKEIAMGVKQLKSEIQYPVTEDTYKLMNILMWSFTGKPLYFREAGHSLTYDVANKGYKESFYEMLLMSYRQLVEACNFYTNYDKFNATMKALDKVKKMSFKYASYADDEIEENLSIKQLIYNIDVTFPRSSPNADYRKAISLVIKGKKSLKSLTPMDIAFLRKVYLQYALDKKSETDNSSINIELQNMCEELLKEQYKGKVKSDHFAYKIIETLKKSGYKKCSQKQYLILEDAYKSINKKIEEKKDDITIIDDTFIDNSLTPSITMEDMMNINEAIGNNSFFDDLED